LPYERESFNIFVLLFRNCFEEREGMIVLKREKRREEMFRERKETKRERGERSKRRRKGKKKKEEGKKKKKSRHILSFSSKSEFDIGSVSKM
jgi:hypothetical protein